MALFKHIYEVSRRFSNRRKRQNYCPYQSGSFLCFVFLFLKPICTSLYVCIVFVLAGGKVRECLLSPIYNLLSGITFYFWARHKYIRFLNTGAWQSVLFLDIVWFAFDLHIYESRSSHLGWGDSCCDLWRDYFLICRVEDEEKPNSHIPIAPKMH